MTALQIKRANALMHSQQMASIVPIVIGCIDYLAYGTIFTHAMFRPKIKIDVFFLPENPQMIAGRWGGEYKANQVPVKNRTCFTYYVHSNVCLLVKHRTHSGFSNYGNPGSGQNSGGIRPECAQMPRAIG
jgi:hypothetical protein